MLDYTIQNDESGKPYLITHYRSKELISIARLNKGTAFTQEEREMFGLLGKIPDRVETIEEQVQRAYLQYLHYEKQKNRNAYLNRLLNFNQILFYKLVIENAAEMLPTIYTPMVGEFVQHYSRRFMHPRGLYISIQNQDRIEELLENRTNLNVKLIVVTDGERVLGIGDQGIGSIAIPIAKLMVYTVFGGINPDVTLPIVLDVGTNNETLLNDPYYLGIRQPRITGDAYQQFIDKFVRAVKKKFPQVFLHWEDFAGYNAHHNLITYQQQICSFNDDIQGTGVVTLAALLSGALKTKTPLAKQRIVLFGGGSAGMGVIDSIYKALLQLGLSESQARNTFWIVDKQGLLTELVAGVTQAQRPYARTKEDLQSWKVKNSKQIDLLEVITNVKPTVLIGTSTKRGAFTEDVIRTMTAQVEHPIILPLSNPNEMAEATPEEIIQWSNGKALFATGSPFPPVTYQGETFTTCQCNNYLAFPGIGLGILAVSALQCTDAMLLAASKALAEFSAKSCETLLPTIDKAAEASTAIAIAVAQQCIADNQTAIRDMNSVETLVEKNRWLPQYLPYKIA